MKKIIIVLALALLLVPGIVTADPTYCTHRGDPALRYGFNQVNHYSSGYVLNPPGSYNQPGPDYGTIYAGQTMTQVLAPYSGSTAWIPTCAVNTVPDSFCMKATSASGWALAGISPGPALNALFTLPGAGYTTPFFLTIKAPCSASIGHIEMIVCQENYWATFTGACAPECIDCNNPNLRPADGLLYYNADTLYLTVVAAPPALAVFQDTLTLVDRGQSQAFVPFSICNQDPCAPVTTYGYKITSKGHVGAAINVTSTIGVAGGDCKDVYGVINASAATTCQFDTLRIIAWTTSGVIVYDTCVQRIHVIDPQPVPLFSVPVVTILVLALILAAAVFMRRRAVSRA